MASDDTDQESTWGRIEELCLQLPLVANRRDEITGQGVVLGAVVNRHGQFMVHSQTAAYAYVVLGVIQALKDSGLWPQGFGFTSFQFLKNPIVSRHTDKNIAQSLIFSFGPFYWR